MKKLLLAAFLLLTPALASAQSVANPPIVTFAASPDHNTVVGTTSVVTSYKLIVVRQTDTATIVQTQDIGKPTPDVSGNITVTGPTLTVKNTLLQMADVTVGPGGSTTSVFSDPFATVAAPSAGGKPTVR